VHSWPRKLLLAPLTLLFTLAIGGAAHAQAPAAGFTVDSQAAPTSFSVHDTERCLATLGVQGSVCDTYHITVTNAGSTATDSNAVTISDSLPPGVTVQKVRFLWSGTGRIAPFFPEPKPSAESDLNGVLTQPPLELPPPCTTGSSTVRCTFPLSQFGFPMLPDDTLELYVYVTVNEPASAGTLTNSVHVSGGGAPGASTSVGNQLEDPPPSFGPSRYSFAVAGFDGTPFTQAGGHPYELTTRIDMNTTVRTTPDGGSQATAIQDVKNVVVDLPLGFLGSALSTPTCTFAELSAHVSAGVGGCPPDTVIGHILTQPESSDSVKGQIYNMVPEHGVAAEFAFVDSIAGDHVIYARVVPGPHGEYVLQATAPDIPQVSLTDVVTTLYGNPAAKQAELAEREGRTPTPIPALPTFTNPMDCSGQPLTSTVYMDSWQNPGRHHPDGTPDLSDPAWVTSTSLESELPPVTGCNLLQFNPVMSAVPDTTAADSPSGLTFGLSVPQIESMQTLATPPLKDAVVSLPAGLTVNPASAGGLAACSPVQIALGNASGPACPDESRIGSVQLTTPLLSGRLSGSVYLATQYENPFHSLLAGYIVVDDPTTGVVVKIPGELKANPGTGQITGVFDNNPQLPFTELKMHFKGGSRGVLATPQSCGLFTTTSSLTPWSAPEPTAGSAATPSSSFEVLSGCASAFAPSFAAGTVSNQAGSFSPLTLSVSRHDGEQRLSGVSVSTPAGLAGVLAGVPLCPEPQAFQGQCGPQSLIGESTVTAGVGPSPYPIGGGRVYLTGPYNGGPFGLSVVVPAVAGPFNLGNVVVRGSIRVDPRTAQITVVSDALPQFVNSVEGLHSGIPADIRSVTVTINRPGFTFNPTSCDPTLVTGALTGTQGASVAVSSRFQAAGCASLKFTPRLQVSTAGKTSKANGAGLFFDITYPKGALGTQSWFNEVKLTFPKQLPARLTTIQKACLAATFEANPAACPPASLIGHAVVHTPVLPVPLAGPVYFVSHGGAKFPDAVIVLQGDGVKVNLTGETFIDGKTGITSATFRNTPDVPFESLEVDIPSGPSSEFGTNLPHEGHNFCGQKLVVPTFFKASNGAEIHQNTPIGVTGCSTKLSVSSRKLKGRNLTLTVYVPAAGKLKATGKGLSTATKNVKGAENVTLTLTTKHRGHPRRHIKVLFTPAHGRKQAVTITLKA
jgi:hypothetical protein